jgi:hypothetical protein
MDCERSLVPFNRRPCLKSSSFPRPVQALLLDNLCRAGVLADRRCQEQCKTGPAAHRSGMNFPCTTQNPEIPARKLNSRENAGKILLE